MRITDRYEALMDRVGSTPTRPVGKLERVSAARDARGPAAGRILDVNVSERAHALASNAARLEALRDAVRNGTYEVDAHAIAARLVGLNEGDGEVR
jgi:hypothetical protein